MPLSELVGFAQEHFGTDTGLQNQEGEDEQLVLRRPRPPVPDWVSGSIQELPIPAEPNEWRIDGSLDEPQSPPDVDHFGIDTLAFYLPYHFNRQGWGVYIRDSGVVYLATVLRGRSLQPGDERYLNLAEDILREHELFHAQSEIASTRAELIARRSLYTPYFKHLEAGLLEEAMANAASIRRCFGENGDLEARAKLEQWMNGQGPGYCEYASWVPSRAFSRGREKATRFMMDSVRLPPRCERLESDSPARCET